MYTCYGLLVIVPFSFAGENIGIGNIYFIVYISIPKFQIGLDKS